jgi:hypothetical protein
LFDPILDLPHEQPRPEFRLPIREYPRLPFHEIPGDRRERNPVVDPMLWWVIVALMLPGALFFVFAMLGALFRAEGAAG